MNKRRMDEEDNSNSNSSLLKKHAAALGNAGSTSSMTIGAITITPVTSTASNASNAGEGRYKESKDAKHKDAKRGDRDHRSSHADRNRDRSCDDRERTMERTGINKDDRMRRDSGGYTSAHYSGARDDDHWMPREGDMRQYNRYCNFAIFQKCSLQNEQLTNFQNQFRFENLSVLKPLLQPATQFLIKNIVLQISGAQKGTVRLVWTNAGWIS